MTGTAIAQAIPIAISPILTRIYKPEDFGAFSLFIAIFSVLGVIATARYELAIIQQENDNDADNMAVLSMGISLLISLISLVVVSVFNENICLFLGSDNISSWLYFVPFSVFLIGCFQSLNYWFNRRKIYSEIAKAKVAQSSMSSLVNLGSFSININGFGLITGYIAGQIVAAIMLFKKVKIQGSIFGSHVNAKTCFKLAKKYHRFPLYSAPGVLLDSLSLQMPVMLISRYFDAATVGFFGLTFRVISAPMLLLSGALSQVLLQKIATSGSSEVYDFVLHMLRKLILVSLPIVVVVFLYGEEIFSFIFGESWRVAGHYSTILIFSIVIRFVVSPLSMVLALERNIRLGLLWQALYFISVTSVLFVYRKETIEHFIVAFVIQDVVMYLLYLYFVIFAIKRMKRCVV
jgi:O-antigen/teichoic acid export membrane protein